MIQNFKTALKIAAGLLALATPVSADVVEACFFTEPGYRGAKLCTGVGTYNRLNGMFENNISSFRVSGGAKVNICTDANMRGECFPGAISVDSFGNILENQASSFRVYTDGSQIGQIGSNNYGPIGLDPGTFTDMLRRDNGAIANAANNGQGGIRFPQFDDPQELPPAQVVGELQPGEFMCVFTNPGYRGARYCENDARRSLSVINLRAGNYTGSFLVRRGAALRACSGQDMRAPCVTIQGSMEQMPRLLRGGVRSFMFYSANRAPSINRHAFIRLPAGRGLDVDRRMAVNGPQEGADFMISTNAQRDMILQPSRNVQLRPMEGANPDFLTCRNARYPSNNRPIVLRNLARNTDFCVRTDRGQYARVRYQGNMNGMVDISYAHWTLR
jgi:hypothetical protein